MIRSGCIYKITNLINGKEYIGQTIYSAEVRWLEHVSKKVDMSINHAIRKYGKNNFIIEELFSAFTLDDLNFMEEYFINYFKTLSPNGYNIHIGGRNRVRAKESVEKQRFKVTRPIIGISVLTNEQIKFRGSKEGLKFGFSPNAIRKVLAGSQILHKNYKFYYDDVNQIGSLETKASKHEQRLGSEPLKREYNDPTSPRYPSKEEIIEYYNKSNSTYKTSNYFNIDRNRIKKLLKSWGKLKTRKEAYLKQDFSHLNNKRIKS